MKTKKAEGNITRSGEILRDENSNEIAIPFEKQKSKCNSISEKSNCILRVKNLFVSYGGINALRGVNIDVVQGQIVSLIGANGAGKSTLLRTISGLVKAQSGNIEFFGEEILGNAIDSICKKGIALVPEGRRVFTDLTVAENLKIGAYLRHDKSQIQKDMDWVYELFPRLKERSWQYAGTLSGGEQQMLAVGRALMSCPRLMMMDEPSLGLAPLIVQQIFTIIEEIKNRGVTILLIEQNANMALKIADNAYVLETGEITLQGSGAELLQNEQVREAYLGKAKKTVRYFLTSQETSVSENVKNIVSQ